MNTSTENHKSAVTGAENLGTGSLGTSFVPVPGEERRSMQRYAYVTPLSIVPVLLDGGPGDLQWGDAVTVDVSASGLSFQCTNAVPIPFRYIVIGAEIPGGGRAFATIRIATQTLGENNQLRIGGVWVNDSDEDVLCAERLRPRIEPQTLSFVYGMPIETLDEWSSLGVLRKYLVDHVLLCSNCGSMPSWRKGCHKCGSGRIHRDRLVHHFACANVGRASEYETAAGLQCPKCRSSSLIVGADFEYIDSPIQCYDCGAQGGQPTMSAMCHRCMRRFSVDDTTETKLYAYHVERLDPLSLFQR